MNDSEDQLALTSPTRLARRAGRLSAGHPFVSDLAICVGVAAMSIAGLATQRRLDAVAVIFCAALCMPLLLRRVSPILCFAVIALVALAQWLLAGPQLADAALLVALYWVALDGSMIEGVLAGGTLELGAVMAAVRWSPSEPLKVWVGLTGLATASAVLGVSIRQRRALLEALTNTLKHAVRPTCAHLALSCRPGRVELEVTDTGQGEEEDRETAMAGAGGRGLHGMRERAATYGDELEAGRRPHGGWRVHLRLDPGAEGVLS